MVGGFDGDGLWSPSAHGGRIVGCIDSAIAAIAANGWDASPRINRRMPLSDPGSASPHSTTVRLPAVRDGDGGLVAVGVTTCKYLDHFPSTGSNRSPSARACRWPGPRWRNGSVAPAWRCSPWQTGWPSCSRNAIACTPTRRRCANWIPAAARPGTLTCGLTDPMCWTRAVQTRPAGPVARARLPASCIAA